MMRVVYALRRKSWIMPVGVLVLIVAVFLVSLHLGAVRLSVKEVWQAFSGNGSPKTDMVLYELRLPRMLLSLMIGACLSVAGTIMQAVTRNDIADPGILGITSGAGLGVVVLILLTSEDTKALDTVRQWGTDSVGASSVAAFVGGAIAALLIYALAWKRGIAPTRLLIVGVAVNAVLGAAIIVIQLLMDKGDFMRAAIWLSGSIWSANWSAVLALLPWIVLLLAVIYFKARILNVLRLGDELAQSAGLSVEKERRHLLLMAAALTGAAVAAGGGIAFVGLLAPHIARKLVGPKHELLLPVSALIGALLLQLSDIVGKHALAPSEIPVGLVVAILGAPYFIFLLLRK